ncbi:MAG: TIGR00730 family Rossman fold protein, partial [Gemmatimonadetes bacterium]|nr:TIGR00730 family Rossman fold protein [Gemmatimonadota bacterium]
MNVCVYCSSSDRVAPRYLEVARELGQLLGERKNNLVFGGGNTGSMNALAEGVKAGGGRVIAVIPTWMHEKGLTFEGSDEIVQTDDMQIRRMTMIKGSDVFIGLPGGLGTLEEITENLTMRQLDLHDKPLCLVDVDGFWKPMLAFFDQLNDGGFLLGEHRDLIYSEPTAADALNRLD